MSASQLQNLAPAIQEICSVSGVAGVSIGVVHHGNPIYTDSFGYRDVENGIKADDETIYYLGSLTKGFTAQAIGILVDEGKLSWTTPVKDILPEFRPSDDVIYNQVTIVDLLGHRSGLERADAIWTQSNGSILLGREDAFRTINQLRAVAPFRTEFRYNNWAYEIAGRIIERLSGVSYSDFLADRIFDPLGMTRTFNSDPSCRGADNVAKGYLACDNSRLFPVPRPRVADGALMNPSGGIQSTISDLLTYYTDLIRSVNDQCQTNKSWTPGSPLKQLAQILSSTIQTAPRLREQSYAMGWARVQLPGTLCDTSRNQALTRSFPTIGDPNHPRLALYHHGMNVGFNSAVYLFPESETAVVLLSNSVAINDGPDWIGHLIIQNLFDDPVKHDFVSIARRTLASGLGSYDRTEQQFQAMLSAREPTPPEPLEAYIGKYFNAAKTFFLHITVKSGNLWMNMQGHAAENYRLKHLGSNAFSWYMSRNEQVKRGRIPIPYLDYWTIKFDLGAFGGTGRISWTAEKDVPTEFTREAVEHGQTC